MTLDRMDHVPKSRPIEIALCSEKHLVQGGEPHHLGEMEVAPAGGSTRVAAAISLPRVKYSATEQPLDEQNVWIDNAWLAVVAEGQDTSMLDGADNHIFHGSCLIKNAAAAILTIHTFQKTNVTLIPEFRSAALSSAMQTALSSAMQNGGDSLW